MNVDRESRDHLVAAIERYVDEETTAFQFDDEITRVRDASDDPTVDYVADELWCHYDDCKDHKVILSKAGWDYFQRLILLLKSDSHMEERRTYRWSVTQPIAAISLLLFGLSLAWLGSGYYLLLVAPLWVVSVLLWRWDDRPVTSSDMRDFALTPFASVGELLDVRRRTVRFAKRRYPAHLKSRSTRRPMSMQVEAMMFVVTYVGWLLLSPLVVFFQLLPVVKHDSRAVTL